MLNTPIPSPSQQVATLAALQALPAVGLTIWLAVITGLSGFRREWVNAALAAWSVAVPRLATGAMMPRVH